MSEKADFETVMGWDFQRGLWQCVNIVQWKEQREEKGVIKVY